MVDKLKVTEALPLVDCSREDIYSLIQTSDPTVELTDQDTITVLNDVLVAGVGVPRWVKVTKDYTDFATNGLTNDIEGFLLPAGGVIHAVKIKQSTEFTGGGITAYTLSVGIAGDLTKYAAAFDIFQAAGDTVFEVSDTVDGETHDAAGTSIRLAATSVTANLDQATAGEVDVWILRTVAI